MSKAAQGKFEKEKETILKSLPDNVKDMFGTMGFCKAEEDEDEEKDPAAPVDDYVPCLVMNPYHVPPKPVRDTYWFDFYSKSKRAKKLGELEYLVYHYGSDDPADCYSFIEQEDFMSYDIGISQGYDKLPAHIQAKVDAGKELTEEEEARVRGLEEMKADALKTKEERGIGKFPFKERHEAMSDYKEPPAKRQKKN